MSGTASSPESSFSEEHQLVGTDLGIVRMSGRGDHLAVALYRALERRPARDIRFVLDAVFSRQGSDSSDSRRATAGSPDDDSATAARQRRALPALRLAVSELGRFPSRRQYDRWRGGRPDADQLPPATFIRKAFDNNLERALAAAGAPAADVAARRLLSNGRAFTEAERRLALRLFAVEVPHGQRTQGAYNDWAHAYVLNPGAANVPVNARSIARHTQGQWFELLMDAGLPDEHALRCSLEAAGHGRRAS